MYQDNRKNSTQPGKWYARSVSTNIVTTDELATVMQANCTVKRADILAVLTELGETVRTELNNSHKVRINGLGLFWVGMSTKPADTPADFNASTNVTGLRVNFRPESKQEKNGTYVKQLIAGCKVQELPKNDVDKTVAPAA